MFTDATDGFATGLQLSTTTRVLFLATDDQRKQLLKRHSEAIVVAGRLPLRANLTVLQNIALVSEFNYRLKPDEAERQTLKWIARVDLARAADLYNPDLSHEERFLAKFLRAAMLRPPMIVIDRPGRMLPDTDYPPFLRQKLAALRDLVQRCTILDYRWNATLYRHPE
jgi:ABC-type nitrate/sulfonate/bicarbonate transport system ATPase subunit